MWKRIVCFFKIEVTRPAIGLLLGLAGTIFFTYVFFSLLPDKTAGLGAMYGLMLVFASVLVIIADRAAVRNFSLINVNLIELAGAIGVYFFILWSYRSVDLIISTKDDHFTLVFLDGGLTTNDFEYIFPFSKRLILKDQECIVLDKKMLEDNSIHIKPADWSGYSVEAKDAYIRGGFNRVIIYWTGNTAANTNDFLACTKNL